MIKAKSSIATAVLSMLLLSPAAWASQRLRIMTFNIPKGNIPAVGLNTWENRAKAIHGFLNQAKPDLLGLQEPVVSELTDLLAGIPGYAMLGVARDDGRQSGEYSPIIYRTERFYVEHSGTYWLSLTPTVVSKNWNSACNRVATWAVFRDKHTNARFLYTNTHLDHVSNQARYQQMRVIKEQMQAIMSKHGEMPAFVTGDFNSPGTEENNPVAVAKSYLAPMNDAYEIAAKHYGLAYTFPASKVKIDYIMLTREVSVSDAYIHNSIYDTGQQLSDHNAHYADISWETTKRQDADALIAEARLSIDSMLTYTAAENLIVSESQITTDGIESGTGVAALIDGKVSSYIESRHSAPLPAEGTHYIQVDLGRTDAGAVAVSLARPLTSSHAGLAPTCVRVEASADASAWDYAADLNDVSYNKAGRYTSPLIPLPAEARHVRLGVVRTDNMDIVVSGPRYAVGELQLARHTLDADNSPAHYDKPLGEAREKLQAAIGAVQASATDETMAALAEALAAFRSLSIPMAQYRALLAEAKALPSRYKSGTSLGQTSDEAKAALADGIAEIESRVSPHAGKAEVEAAIARCRELVDAFYDSLVYFEEGKWFYIVNQARIATGTTRNRTIYATAPVDSRSPLQASIKDSTGTQVSGSKNPFAMWRFVRAEGGSHAYDLQNRATGYYMGLPQGGEDSCYTGSLAPVAFLPGFFADGEFSLAPVGNAGRYLSASTDGRLYNGTGEAASKASWKLKAVDEDLEYIEVPVRSGSISIVCLPYKVEGIRQRNPDMQGYAINSIPQLLPTVNLQKKDTFAAGEPFILLVGKPQEGAETTATAMRLAPPDEFTSEPVAANGLVGTLDRTTAPASLLFVDNILRRTTSPTVLPGQSGYIDRTQATATGAAIDLTVNTNTLVNAIRSAKAAAPQSGEVFTIDGVRLPPGGKPARGGVYIIGGRKVAN